MALPELYKEQEFQRQTFDRNSQFMKHNPNLTARGTRKFNRYWNSDQRLEDEKAFNAAQDAAEVAHIEAEAKKRAESWDARIAALREQNAARGAAALKSINASLAAKPTVPASKPVPAPVAKTLTPRSEADWNRIASEATNGQLKTMADVEAWQRANGFSEDQIDGKFGDYSRKQFDKINLGKYTNSDPTATIDVEDWTKHLRNLGYTEELLQDGSSAFVNNGTYYYSNGSMTRADGTTGKYMYKHLPFASTSSKPAAPKPSYYTLQQVYDMDNYREPYKMTRKATVNGKAYPIIVTTGMLLNSAGLENDHSYAYDESTGRIIKLQEDWTGGVKHGKTEGDWMPLPIFKKQGGTMNRINYFQQGGAAHQQDMQQQVIALVQAAMQGDQKATETVNKIMEAAKAGDQQAMQIAQMIQQVAQKMQGQATAAKWGSKLNYIRSLKFAKGGKACPACEKGAPIVEKKACGGKKAKKRYFGGLI